MTPSIILSDFDFQVVHRAGIKHKGQVSIATENQTKAKVHLKLIFQIWRLKLQAVLTHRLRLSVEK